MIGADSPDALLQTLEQRITKQQGVVRNAAALDGPGAMGGLQPYFLNSMQYRQSGLQGVKDALEQAFSNQNRQDKTVTQDEAAQVSTTLSAADRVRRRLRGLLPPAGGHGAAGEEHRGRRGRPVGLRRRAGDGAREPEADAGRAGVDPRRHAGGGDTTGSGRHGHRHHDTTDDTNGRHGLSLDANCCSYLAGGSAAAKELSPTELNEADANSDGPMTLRVRVKNSGDFPESDLTVTVQIDDKEFTQKITALDEGQEETVDIEFTIDDIDVSLETSITVTAEPVENEFNKQNNQQKFRVQFQLA